MGSCHQFGRAAAVVDNRTSVPIITVQSLVALRLMVLRADHPYNHVICSISRGGKGRAATASGPGHIPPAGNVDGRRIGRGNTESLENGVAIVVGAERDIGALFGSIGDCLPAGSCYWQPEIRLSAH